MTLVLVTQLCLKITGISSIRECAFLPFPFDLPDDDFVAVTLLQCVKQMLIQLQAVFSAIRVRN